MVEGIPRDCCSEDKALTSGIAQNLGRFLQGFLGRFLSGICSVLQRFVQIVL